MSRRGVARIRVPQPDRRYNNVLVSKFINSIMKKGKKSLAEKIFYNAIDLIEQKTGQDGITVFNRAVANVKPNLEVRSRRVGGSTYQVPIEIRPARKEALAIRWILTFALKRRGNSMATRLSAELMDAASGESVGSVKKKEDTHKMAEANKAFAHYRW